MAHEIVAIVEGLAPYALAHEDEELGIIWGSGNRVVRSIGVTWSPTASVLYEAADSNITMLIVHEPLFQAMASSVIPVSELPYSPNSIREKFLRDGNVTVMRVHSNWDDAQHGTNDTLASRLAISVERPIPYGRIGSMKPQSLRDFAAFVRRALGCQSALVVGKGSRSITRVAVISDGGNALPEVIEYAKKQGADVLVSGGLQDSQARLAYELDLCIVDAGSYCAETPGMKRLAELLRQRLSGIPISYLDPGPPWTVCTD